MLDEPDAVGRREFFRFFSQRCHAISHGARLARNRLTTEGAYAIRKAAAAIFTSRSPGVMLTRISALLETRKDKIL